MLKKTYEWLRVVYPKPDDRTVEGRQKTVAELLGKLDQAVDQDLLGAFLTAALAGFDGLFDSDSPPVATLVESIRKYQPAFPSDLAENALELRICCALAIGEVLTRAPKKGQRSDPVLAASLLLSGAGVRPEVEGKHLRDVISELLAEATRVIKDGALEVRRRDELDLSSLEEIAPDSDVSSFWNELLPVLRECFNVIEDRARADREELEVLWWFYNAFSESLGKPLAAMPGEGAAFVGGVEVGDRVLLPPHPGIADMVADAVVRDRKKGEVAARTLGRIASVWDDSVRKLLPPADQDARQFSLNFPALLPLSWLSIRLVESRGAAGWEGEFERKTAISPTHEVNLQKLARQVFRERVAQRLLAKGGSG